MMKIKNIILMMAAMGLLGACAEADEQQKAQGGEAVTIQLTANVASETLTMGNPSAWTRDAWDAYQSRALTRGIQETTLINGQKVYLWADKGTAGTYTFLQAWNLTSDGSGGLSGTTKYYPTDGDGLTFRAVHGNFSTAPTEGTAIGTLTHTVLDDQSTAGNYEKSDLMDGEGTGSWESAGTVDFVHKLSKIEVNLTPGIGLIPSDMTSATVQIRGVKPTVSINAQTGELGSASGTATTITARHTGNGCFEAVIPPQTAPSGMLTVTIGDVTATIPNAVATFASNSKYVYNVKCTNKDKHLNPLWYVAENNVKSYNSSTKVVTLETSPTAAGSSYCYSWADAMVYFSKQGSSYDEYWAGDITDGSTSFKYHLPCIKEWFSIAPVFYTTDNLENMFATSANDPFVASGAYTEPACVFGYSSATKTSTSYNSYWSTYTTANVRYAIRFLGTPYCSVWKYQFSGSVLTITAKLIDYIAVGDASLSTKLSSYMSKGDSWWNSNDENEGAIQRKFYAVGNYQNGGSGGTGTADNGRGEHGHYWSTTESSATQALRLYLHSNYLMNADEKKKWGFPVRLFRHTGVGEGRTYQVISMAEVTAADVGKVIAANGWVYPTVSIANSTGSTASGIIAYCGSAGSADASSSTYKGLAIAIADTSNGAPWCGYTSMDCTTNANSASAAVGCKNGIAATNQLINTTNTHSHQAAYVARNYTTASRPSGASAWFLPAAGQWNLIVKGLTGGTANLTESNNATYSSTNVNSKITAVGGTSLRVGAGYWSSTQIGTSCAWFYAHTTAGGRLGYADKNNNSTTYPVRAVFAF